jgi:hypothetical protein
MEDQDKKRNIQQDVQDWKKSYEASELTPEELFKQISHIAITLSYDLVDKLRYWEKETLKEPPEEIERRLKHMAECLDELKRAYLKFAELEF